MAGAEIPIKIFVGRMPRCLLSRINLKLPPFALALIVVLIYRISISNIYQYIKNISEKQTELK